MFHALFLLFLHSLFSLSLPALQGGPATARRSHRKAFGGRGCHCLTLGGHWCAQHRTGQHNRRILGGLEHTPRELPPLQFPRQPPPPHQVCSLEFFSRSCFLKVPSDEPGRPTLLLLRCPPSCCPKGLAKW